MKPQIHSSLKDTMFDAPVEITVTGLIPHQIISLHSHASKDAKNSFECVAIYVADDQGCISLRRDKSIGGSYLGVEPMGLFWAMKPSLSNQKLYARLAKIVVTTPLVVTIRLYDAKVQSLEELHEIRKQGGLEQVQLASVKLNRWYMSSGTRRIPFTVERDGISGTLFLPPGKGPFPGVVTMFGGYPGTLEYKASLLASHGFAALALAFSGVPGLPEFNQFQELKLEYFEKAVTLMSNYKEVRFESGIGVMGLSFSSFIVLAMGECLKHVKCVVSINGFTYPMFGNISYKGKLYENQVYEGYTEEGTEKRQDGHGPIYFGRNFYPKHPDPFHHDLDKSRIKFYDRHDVAYMFIVGLDDKSVPAEYFANQAEKLLKSSKHPNYKILRYPGAGHLIEPCYGPHHNLTVLSLYNVSMMWGGEMVPHCKAQEDAWMQQIQFFKSNLSCGNYCKL